MKSGKWKLSEKRCRGSCTVEAAFLFPMILLLLLLLFSRGVTEQQEIAAQVRELEKENDWTERNAACLSWIRLTGSLKD